MPSDDLKSGELPRSLVENMSAMVAYWDSSLHCRFANRAYESWFGVSAEALIGKHISDLLGPLYPSNLPFIEGALRGEPQEFERTIPSPSGGPPRHSLANYIPDIVDGVVRGFFVLVTDISASNKAEEALRHSEERFRLTIDEAPIGMALVAPDGRFIRVNRAISEIVGYTPEELTSLTFQAITHPEDLDADLALAGQLARGEIPRYKLEKRYVRKDGSIVEIMLSGSALRGPDGAPVYYIAQIEDITEQKRRERGQKFLAEVGPTLATSLDYEDTLTRVVDLAAGNLADFAILVVTDENTQIHRLKVACRDPEKGWLCELFTKPPRDCDRLLCSVAKTRRPVLMQRPSVKTIAMLAQSEEQQRAIGELNMRSMIAVPLVAHGRNVGAIALVSLTESVAYGRADVRLAEQLAERAALSIENARLYRAAQRATQARDEVLGVVAHDLRSPLQSVVMQAAILRGEAGLDPASRKSAALIERAATRMNRLIQDLLDFTSLEAGRLSIRPTNVLAAQLVADCVEAQKPLAACASLELRLELAPDVPSVWADRDRLLQIFENLIGNAIKFSSAGGHITVGAKPLDDEVLFWVSDTGMGIAEQDQPHVFDRFWQAEATDSRGAGLGLPIVKGIVEAHGGRIWVESVKASGSSFFFTMPCAHFQET